MTTGTADLYQWRKPDSVAHSKELAKMLFYIAPVMYSVKFYDEHWASKSGRQADIHGIARRAKGDWSAADVPVSLPRMRKRTLTGPLPPIETLSNLSQSIRRSRQSTDNQAGCLLLSMLPYEIRLDIYDEIFLGGKEAKLIHILRKNGRLGHWRCRLQEDGGEECDTRNKTRCMEGWLSYKARVWHLDKVGMVDLRTDGGMIPLLMTCRVIYTEAIRILYSKNTFQFYDPGDIRYFGKTILPQRLNSITSIMMDWERPFSIFNKDNRIPKMDREELRLWKEVWAIIAGMESLKDLKVILKPHKAEVPYERRKIMCEPMMEIKGLRKFELVLPWNDEGEWDFAEHAPFTITKGINLTEEDDDEDS